MTKTNVNGAQLLSCEEKPMRWYWKVLIAVGIISLAYLFGSIAYIVMSGLS